MDKFDSLDHCELAIMRHIYFKNEKDNEYKRMIRKRISDHIRSSKTLPVYISFFELELSYKVADDISRELEDLGWEPTVVMREPNEKNILYVDYIKLQDNKK